MYASETSLSIVFVNSVHKLTGEMPINWSFFLDVRHSVNSLSVSLTDWTLSWSSIQGVCLYQKFSFRLTANSFPGTTLIFLAFSCWAILRVITCLPLTLQRCFMNTPQHLLLLLSKTLKTLVHNLTHGHFFLFHI